MPTMYHVVSVLHTIQLTIKTDTSQKKWKTQMGPMTYEYSLLHEMHVYSVTLFLQANETNIQLMKNIRYIL